MWVRPKMRYVVGMRQPRLLLVVLLTACTGDSGEGAGKDDSRGDDSEAEEAQLRFVLSTGEEVWLAAYDPSAEDPVGAVGWTVSAAEATAGFRLDPPDVALLQPLDPAAPDMLAMPMVPALIEGGVVVGIGEHRPTWIQGTIPDNYAEMGLKQGWNAIYIDPSHQIIVTDPLQMPLSDNLRLQQSLSLEGGSHGPAAARLALLAQDGLQGPVLGSVAETTLGSDWDFSLSSAPEAGNFKDDPAMGAVATLVPTGFEDGDGTGAWSSGDSAQHGACYQEKPAWVLYLRPQEDVGIALERFRRHLRDGWNVQIGSESQPEGLADGSPLDAVYSCPLPSL